MTLCGEKKERTLLLLLKLRCSVSFLLHPLGRSVSTLLLFCSYEVVRSLAVAARALLTDVILCILVSPNRPLANGTDCTLANERALLAACPPPFVATR